MAVTVRSILELCQKEQRSVQELNKILVHVSANEVAQLFQDVLKNRVPSDNATEDALMVLHALTRDTWDKVHAYIDRRAIYLQTLVQWLSTAQMSTAGDDEKWFTEAAMFADTIMDTMPISTLQQQTMEILQAIQKDPTKLHLRLLDLLPRMLHILGSKDEIAVQMTKPTRKDLVDSQEDHRMDNDGDMNVDSGAQTMSGRKFVAYIVQTLAMCRWHPRLVIRLAYVIREIPLQPKEFAILYDKLTRQLKYMDVNEIPPLIYQILLLSQKVQKHCLFGRVCQFFHELDQAFALDKHQPYQTLSKQTIHFPQLVAMEATVFLHLSYAVRQNQELGAEFIKYNKTNRRVFITSFNISCLLSMARIHRFEEPVMELLKSSISAIFKADHFLDQKTWLNSAADKFDLEKVFQQIIERSTADWDQVIHTLLQLGVGLISSQANMSRWGKSSGPAVVKFGKAQTPQDAASMLGVRILADLFKVHEIVRHEILAQISQHILARSDGALYFVHLLELIVKDQPNSLRVHVPRLREMFEYVIDSNDTIEALVKATSEALWHYGDLRDGVMLIFRKGVFTRQTESRVVALHGLLALLRLCGTQSTAGTSKRVNEPQALSLEIVSILRRCLSQPGEVRMLLYEGLTGTEQDSASLRYSIIDMLASQFFLYYERDGQVTVPLHLERCLTVAHGDNPPQMKEPLHHLIYALCHTILPAIVRMDNADEWERQRLSECHESLISTAKRLAKADFEDFALDKSAEYDLATDDGICNNMSAAVLFGSYEALMYYSISLSAQGHDHGDVALKLFANMQKLYELLKEKNPGGRGRKKPISLTEHSLLQLPEIVRMCQYLTSDEPGSEPWQAIRANDDFSRYARQVLQAKVNKSLESTGIMEDVVFVHLTSVAEMLTSTVFISNENEQLQCEQNKAGTIAQSLETLSAIFDNLSKFHPERLPALVSRCLHSVQMSQAERTVEPVLHCDLFIQQLLPLINELMDARPPMARGAAAGASIIRAIATFLLQCDEHADYFKRLRNRIEQLCVERPLEENHLVKEVLHLLILLSLDADDFSDLIQLASDIKSTLGALQEGQGDDPMTRYSIVNPSTAAIAADVVMAVGDQTLDQIDWCIAHVKMEFTADAEVDEKLLKLEDAMYMRLKTMMTIITTLCQTLLEGPTAEKLIKLLQKCFKTLLALTKLQLQSSHSLTKDFGEVVRIAGGPLSTAMYNFLTTFGQRVDYAESKGKRKQGSSGGNKAKAKIIRESKMIPALIFTVEQYERFLLQLSKKSKVNLMKYTKRSTARDFKIKIEHIVDQEEEESDTENLKAAMDARSESPFRLKARLQRESATEA